MEKTFKLIVSDWDFLSETDCVIKKWYIQDTKTWNCFSVQILEEMPVVTVERDAYWNDVVVD